MTFLLSLFKVFLRQSSAGERQFFTIKFGLIVRPYHAPDYLFALSSKTDCRLVVPKLARSSLFRVYHHCLRDAPPYIQ